MMKDQGLMTDNRAGGPAGGGGRGSEGGGE